MKYHCYIVAALVGILSTLASSVEAIDTAEEEFSSADEEWLLELEVEEEARLLQDGNTTLFTASAGTVSYVSANIVRPSKLTGLRGRRLRLEDNENY